MIGLAYYNATPTTLDLNGPFLKFTSEPSSQTVDDAATHAGNVSSLIQVSYNGYPVRGYLYYPTTPNTGQSLDVVVLYHGTITSAGVSPADAASTFISIALNKVNLKDKLVFSVAYPQDFIPLWQANPALPAIQFPGLDYPNLYLGDNIVYAEAALLWVKNELNSFLSSNNIPKTVNKVYTFGHSQGAYLVHRLNTLHTVDGVISNAPGPIDLLTRCSGVNQTETGSCNKIGLGIGLTSTDPDAYNSRSLKSFLSGTLSPTLFTQALDDDTADEFGTPQVANMKDIMQAGLSTCTDCAAITFNYYETGGHDAFVTNTYLQNDIRSFVGAVGAGIATFVGIATAEFKTNPEATNTGYISYKWYENDTALEDGINVAGSGTTTLTLSNLSNPEDTGKNLVLRVNYVPSAYQTTSPVTAGTARSTDYASNAPLDIANAAVLTVNPIITINTQPSDDTVAQTQNATFTVDASASDSSDLTYQWNVNGSPVSDSATVSGSTTPTLTISSPDVSTSTVSVTVSHPTAGNSPVTSDSATWAVVSARQILNYELVSGDGGFYGTGSQNLFDGPITFSGNSQIVGRSTVFYAPEKDLRVRATMRGGVGVERNGNRGGEGGSAVFEFTIYKNEEYTLKLGAATPPTGGTNGGGASAYLYRKGRLIVALGGGGGAGSRGRGGDGGGIGIAGETGRGRYAGRGGSVYSTGTLPTIGVFPGGSVYGGVNWSAADGGRVSGCTIGGYYNYISPCSDIGVSQFRTAAGSIISQTASILRGFKSGLGHRNNGGNASGDNGGGASGATGGDAGIGDGSGGGGGSGYSSGEVTVISTRLGGGTSRDSFITIEVIN